MKIENRQNSSTIWLPRRGAPVCFAKLQKRRRRWKEERTKPEFSLRTGKGKTENNEEKTVNEAKAEVKMTGCTY